MLSFQKAFKQIAATIKLCFVGLSTFVVEFVIVFGSFCCFFYFILGSDLKNFYTFPFTIQNTIAMSIGKFNFAALRAASETAAWIFFVFSIVVNMILINMMMAIINMAFEDIKAQGDSFKNKFEIIEYIKRSTKELSGVQMAKRELPVYKGNKDVEGVVEERKEEGNGEEKTLSGEFSDKTNQLLDYIEDTYLKGMANDEKGKSLLDKMKLDNKQKAKAMDYGFNEIFSGGGTTTPNPEEMIKEALKDEEVAQDLGEEQLAQIAGLDVSQISLGDGVSMSNVDGMNM